MSKKSSKFILDFFKLNIGCFKGRKEEEVRKENALKKGAERNAFLLTFLYRFYIIEIRKEVSAMGKFIICQLDRLDLDQVLIVGDITFAKKLGNKERLC